MTFTINKQLWTLLTLFVAPASAGLIDCYTITVEPDYAAPIGIQIYYGAQGCAEVHAGHTEICESGHILTGGAKHHQYTYDWGTTAPSVWLSIYDNPSYCYDSIEEHFGYCGGTPAFEDNWSCFATPPCDATRTLDVDEQIIWDLSGGCYGICTGCGKADATYTGTYGARRLRKLEGDSFGTMSMFFDSRNVDPTIRFNLEGLEPNEQDLTISVMNTNSCAVAELQDATPHYNTTMHGDFNPFEIRTFSSNEDGTAYGSFRVHHGLNLDDINGFATVVSDADGNHLVCGILYVNEDETIDTTTMLPAVVIEADAGTGGTSADAAGTGGTSAAVAGSPRGLVWSVGTLLAVAASTTMI